MATRHPVVAGTFYPGDEAGARREVQRALQQAKTGELPGPIRAGVVPHAGWSFSGVTAAHFFRALGQQGLPEMVILLGAVHRWGVDAAAIYSSGSWQTPLGRLPIDEQLAEEALRIGGKALVRAPQAHQDEHSIEVQLPFIQQLYTEAGAGCAASCAILPVAVPPESDAQEAGRLLARAAERLGRRAVAVASSDLTHYGPRYGMAPAGVGEAALEWTHCNDRRIIDRMLEMRADEVLREAQSHHNACGAGAIAAAIAFAQETGANQGVLLAYTTSHEVMPMGAPSDMVGYAAVAFCVSASG
jgi:MEMO1 family protein